MTSKQTSKRVSKIEPEIMDFVGLDGPAVLENLACYQGALLGYMEQREREEEDA